MPSNIQLNFVNPINVSVQPGDRIYAARTSSPGVHDEANLASLIYLGNCFSVCNDCGPNNNPQIIVDPTSPAYTPPNSIPAGYNYIMFSKDNSVNLGNMKGYFAELELRNNALNVKSEVFSVGMEAAQSSK